MTSERRAVIDVGTNSVKLLVAERAGAIVRPILETSQQTRLGRGFYDDHRLGAGAIAQTAEVVGRFAETARQNGVVAVRVLATSAARDAVNKADLVTAIRRASGLEPEIISGEVEAEWAFRGVTSDPRFAGRRLLILDVGGGSTEFVVGRGEHHSFRQSFPLGSVRLLERLRPSDPPTREDLARCRQWLNNLFEGHITTAVRAAMRDAGGDEVLLVGTGGTSTLLARMLLAMDDFDRDRIESVVLARAQVEERMEHLWRLSLAERQTLPGLPANRADVILMGAAIFEAAMTHLGHRELHISTRGLRFGALLAQTETPPVRRLDSPAAAAESRAAL